MKTIKDSIKSLLEITDNLRDKYPSRKFTLDGRLVGDIGEILADHLFEIDLYGKQAKHYDATLKKDTNKKVQIKATMKNSLTFPIGHTPEYYLGLKISVSGHVNVIFNGPGLIIQDYLNKNRKRPKTGLYNVSNSILQTLDAQVNDEERIPKKITT